MTTTRQQVTELLLLWNRGERQALDQLMPVVHAQLHKLARGYVARERAALDATELVNEAYLRLVDMSRVAMADRAHFFAVAARIMRHILVDMARARLMQKRGGGATRVSLSHLIDELPAPAFDVLGVHQALDKLAAFDARRARVVELRVFGGLTLEETALALEVSSDTVSRDWKLAKAWLARELSATDPR